MLSLEISPIAIVINIILYNIAVRRTEPTESLQVVPVIPGEDLQTFYLRVREKNQRLDENQPRESTMDPRRKEQICSNILKSGIFHGMAKPLKMDRWYRFWKLIIKFPGSMKHFSDKKTIFTRTHLTYPSRMVEVHLTHILKEQFVFENVFICLARDLRVRKRRLLDFHISEEYNVNLDSEDYIAGRFITVKENHQNDEQHILLYLAEEPAKVIKEKSKELEDIYLQSRRSQEIGKRAESSNAKSLCNLNGNRLVQICSSVLSSSYFDGQVKYLPTPELDLEHKCITIKITFQYQRSRFTRSEPQAVSCSAQLTNGRSTTYYISYGEKPHNIFVFALHPSDNFIYLLNLSTTTGRYCEHHQDDADGDNETSSSEEWLPLKTQIKNLNKT